MGEQINILKRKIGVTFNQNKHAEVTVWSPFAEEVNLRIVELDTEIAMQSQNFGYWYLQTALLKPGQQYAFEIIKKGEKFLRADPASLIQAEGVHGSSTSFDTTNYPFTDQDWKGIPISEYIIYELHTGTFSQEGNFLGIEQKLDYLIELGITAIEIMPIAEFPGARNWGYDGVFPFAVQSTYGGAMSLQNLVNACHQKGLAVILDVVYNHFGPEGSYFADFAPYFTDKYHTPWGSAINFDDAYADGVRHFFIENVLMWFRDFHIDALRLDAVHAIRDFSAKHILAEIKENVDELNARLNRNHQLIIECDLNDYRYIAPLGQKGLGMDAQWVDEFHHSLRVAAGQKRDGYYADFNGVSHLAKAYQDVYVYNGVFSPERKKTFGSKAEGNRGDQFVVFSQNHDQVGNRMLGERTSVLHSFNMQKVLAGAVCIAPFIPLFFMGEEYGETNPFLYFISHTDPKLVAAVRKGRSEEFKSFHIEGEVPDPYDEKTFQQSKLQWLKEEKPQQLFRYYQTLISLRKNHPILKNLDRSKIEAFPFNEQNCLVVHRFNEEEQMLCLLNFSNQVQRIENPLPAEKWKKYLDSNDETWGDGQANQQSVLEDIEITIAAETFIIYTSKNG